MNEAKKTPQEMMAHEVFISESGDMEMKFASLVITCINSGNGAKTSVLVDGRELAHGTHGVSFAHDTSGDVRVCLKKRIQLTPAIT